MESGHILLTLTRDQKVSACELSVANFDYSPNAIIPLVLLEFNRGQCSPQIEPKLEKEILAHLTLKVQKSTGGKYQALFQWLRYVQPSDCSAVRFGDDSVRSAYQRWKAGTWGVK